jgi:hypothetical protein
MSSTNLGKARALDTVLQDLTLKQTPTMKCDGRRNNNKITNQNMTSSKFDKK